MVAKICGVSKYGSPWDAYRQLVEGYQVETTLPMKVGKALEKELLPELYRAATPGLKLYPPQEVTLEDWARGHLDGVGENADGERWVVEYKTASIRTVKEWGAMEDQIPTDYLCQVQFYMLLTGLRKSEVAVLLGNEDFQVRTIHFDADFAERMEDTCKRFWVDHVLTQRPPPIDFSDACKAWLLERNPPPEERKEEMLEPTEDELEILKDWREAKKQQDQAGQLLALCRNRIDERIGAAKGIKGVALKTTKGHIRFFGDEQ